MQSFYGLSFPDAVTMLLGGEHEIKYSMTNKKEENMSRATRKFALPSRNNNMRRVFAYLIKNRLIDKDVVSFFAKEKLIYESKELSADKTKEYHNAVFVGLDKNGVPCHAHKHGIYTQGKSFKGNIDSSNPCFSFHYTGTSGKLYVFEAPIDMMSFISIYKDYKWQNHSYVALCGLSEKAMLKMLENNHNLNRVVLCLDNDKAGQTACQKLKKMLDEKNISCSKLVPKLKDFNEDLKEMNKISQPQHEIVMA